MTKTNYYIQIVPTLDWFFGSLKPKLKVNSDFISCFCNWCYFGVFVIKIKLRNTSSVNHFNTNTNRTHLQYFNFTNNSCVIIHSLFWFLLPFPTNANLHDLSRNSLIHWQKALRKIYWHGDVTKIVAKRSIYIYIMNYIFIQFVSINFISKLV